MALIRNSFFYAYKIRVFFRRLKKNVLSELPSKTREVVILDPGAVKINKNMKTSHKLVSTIKVGVISF